MRPPLVHNSNGHGDIHAAGFECLRSLASNLRGCLKARTDHFECAAPALPIPLGDFRDGGCSWEYSKTVFLAAGFA